MKPLIPLAFIIFLIGCNLSCNNPIKKGEVENLTMSSVISKSAPSFYIGVNEIKLPNPLPGLQSFVWGRLNNKIVLIGGRIEGFHGLTGRDSAFKSRLANTSVFVLDIATYSYKEMKMDAIDLSLQQFFSTNMEFCQNGDSLFLVGGFGKINTSDLRSNYTFNKMVTLSISSLINQVEMSNGNIKKAILQTASSPILQVTGGELYKKGNIFYLSFGQNFNQIYSIGTTGIYTSSVKTFSVTNGIISDTASYVNSTMLHRRDLPVTEIITKDQVMLAAFGGVFSSTNDGYLNPVYVSMNGKSISAIQDTLIQKTNQYDCAMISIFDVTSNSNTTVLLGGIGQYQYHVSTGIWENGDQGAKLPFVKTITQMIYQNGKMTQNIQIPPKYPELPVLIGANAIFIPSANLIYSNKTIDYSKITSDSTSIGLMYGGILSQMPTSSEIYPTSLNTKLYQVYLVKNKSGK